VSGRQSWEQQVSADLGAIKQHLESLPCKEHGERIDTLWNGATYNRGMRAGMVLFLAGAGGTIGTLVTKYGSMLLAALNGGP